MNRFRGVTVFVVLALVVAVGFTVLNEQVEATYCYWTDYTAWPTDYGDSSAVGDRVWVHATANGRVAWTTSGAMISTTVISHLLTGWIWHSTELMDCQTASDIAGNQADGINQLAVALGGHDYKITTAHSNRIRIDTLWDNTDDPMGYNWGTATYDNSNLYVETD